MNRQLSGSAMAGLMTAGLLMAALPGAATAQADPVPAGPTINAVAGDATAGTTLDVIAEGRTTRVPDLATIRAGVVTQGATAPAALADNAARMTRVLAALKKAGVAPRDIATASVSLQPQYRYGENQPPQVTGYQATNSVAIRFRAVDRAGAILDALVAEGANQIDGPNLELADPDAALDEARIDAVRRARARAELYARAAGLSVSRIVSIGEGGQDAGGPNPPVVFARAVRAEAPTPIATGEKDVTVSLSVRFLLR